MEAFLFVEDVVPWTMEAAKQIIDETKAAAIARSYPRSLFDLTLWERPDGDDAVLVGEESDLAARVPIQDRGFHSPQVISKFGERAAINRAALSGSSRTLRSRTRDF
jgi:hypothetical protein